ncbi:MAG: gluconokinase [Chitinophagaceae bacterium]|nr:gluconokinase [Chitinophagaceae bacterium]
MALTLAIDMGTTNLKVGLINERGEILSLCAAGIKTRSVETGAAEHDPEELKNLVVNLSRQVLQDNDKDDVQFICSSTYHFGLMMLDEQRRPLTGITLLSDTRSQHTFPHFLSEYADDDLYQKTGCPLIGQYILPRLFYFSKEKPQLLRAAKYFHDSKSFLFEWLTGEWVTDISTAAATQLFNIHLFQWDQEILSKVGLSSEQFPLPADGTTFCAPLRKEISALLGLKEGVKAVLGVYDGAALSMGLSSLNPGIGIINIGTTAMLRIPGRYPVFDKNENKRIQAYAFNKDLFLNGGALNNAALPLDWMRNNLFDFDVQDSTLLRDSNEPPLISLPYLTGERDSKTGPYASGVFFGIRRHHSRIDFARSVLEGVAYSLRYIYDALKENNMEVKEIRMGGGGVNIGVWPQIFADVLGVPVVIPSGREPALMGSSMLAFTAGGIFRDVDEASKNIRSETQCIVPNSASMEIRDKHYQFFKKLREGLASLYEAHAGLYS